jgi:hypothetical protein
VKKEASLREKRGGPTFAALPFVSEPEPVDFR